MTGTLAALAALLVALPVLINTVVYAGRRRVLAEGSPSPRELEVRGSSLPPFLRECAATALAMALRPLPRPTAVRPRRPLAILLPDAGQSAGAFLLLRRRLGRIGWESVLGVRQTMPHRLDEAVEELGRRIESIAAEHRVLSLIGHGSGGLVGRAYLLGRFDRRVRQLITLGTPHQGTLAPHARLPCCRPLARGSALLRRLGSDADRPPSPERIAIYSEFDAWVLPVEAAYYPGAFNIQVRGVGHFSLLTSRRVFELLAENLANRLDQAEEV